MVRRIGPETMVLGLVWPDGQLPQIDEIDGEPQVEMPRAAAAIPQSQNVTLNFNAGDALQTVEAVLTRIDRERGLTLWPEFLQLAADHPQSPKASKVQTALAVDLEDEPTPMEAGDELASVTTEPEPKVSSTVTEVGGFEVLQAVGHKLHGQGVIRRLFPSTFGKGNASVDFEGHAQVVPLSELTPFDPGGLSLVPGSDATTDPEPSQSQLC